MQLRIIVPGRVVLDMEVSEIHGQGSQGAFGLWANDSDCVSDLVPGVLRYQVPGAEGRYAGLAAGILVKKGQTVTITTRCAYLGNDPAEVARRIRAEVRDAEDAAQLERTALERLKDEMERQFRILGYPICEAPTLAAVPDVTEA